MTRVRHAKHVMTVDTTKDGCDLLPARRARTRRAGAPGHEPPPAAVGALARPPPSPRSHPARTCTTERIRFQADRAAHAAPRRRHSPGREAVEVGPERVLEGRRDLSGPGDPKAAEHLVVHLEAAPLLVRPPSAGAGLRLLPLPLRRRRRRRILHGHGSYREAARDDGARGGAYRHETAAL